MSLKSRYEKLEEVPQGAREFYKEENGNFVLEVDGLADRASLEQTNQEKISLLTQLDELKKRYEGIDPNAVRELEAQKRKLEEEQALKAGEVERVIESRLKTFQSVHAKQVADVTSERDALVARLSEIQIDQGVVAAATRKGLRPTAITDITMRARQTFWLINGVPTAMEKDGKTVRGGKNGTALGIEEWVESLVTDAPHLFEGNNGVLSRPDTGEKAKPRNPFRKATWNLTEQARLLKANPTLAQAMKEEAGLGGS